MMISMGTNTMIMTMSFSVPTKPSCLVWTKNNMNTLKPCFASSSSFNAAAPNHLPFHSHEVDTPSAPTPVLERRTGNYQPPLWEFEHIQSLQSEFSGEKYSSRVSELKEQVSKMILEDASPVDQLEFIDDLQRLGISYHFEYKIKKMLSRLYMNKYLKNDVLQEKDLYTESLAFRLFRQHGFIVSQDAFDCFKDVKGEFNSNLTNDTRGLLQLYEASHVLTKAESTLEQATKFTTLVLQQKLDNLTHPIDQNLASNIRQALELPLHWKPERPNTRSFIHEYEGRPDMNPVLLELAKLDFNILQSTYQEEIKHVSRWWEKAGLIEKLPFARDRVVESYFWASAFLYEPQYGYYRIMIAKLINLISLFDDTYDIYGTLQELRLFNKVIQRWDREKYDELPEYMQVLWVGLNNFIDDSVNYVLNSQGLDITPYLRKTWTDYSTVNLQEATWYHQGYTPTVEEYMKGAWFSVSGPVVLTHAFFLVANPIKKEDVKSIYKYHNIVWSSSLIFRLNNDCGTSPDEMKRGDVPKTIQCYMNEAGVSGKEAREYLNSLLQETWKSLNKELAVAKHGLPTSFIRTAMGLARTSHQVYQNGDGFGFHSAKDQISNLLFYPIV